MLTRVTNLTNRDCGGRDIVVLAVPSPAIIVWRTKDIKHGTRILCSKAMHITTIFWI
jgi:hypothetical protein